MQKKGGLVEDLPTFQNPEHITTLLLSPSLLEFDRLNFQNPVSSQAVVAALKTGSPITCLDFPNCNFSDRAGSEGSIVHTLQRNLTVKTLILVDTEHDDGICDALTSLLLLNTTLTDLKVSTSHLRRTWLHPFSVALRINTSLKKLDVEDLSLSDELVCGALCEVFAKNSVLEELTLHCVDDSLVGDTDVASWRKTLPFLRDNKTLKSSTFGVHGGRLDTRVNTLCIDTAALLGDSIALECLNIYSRGFSLNNYCNALESLQTNTTLKTLRLHPRFNSVSEDGQMQRLISLVKKNYGLENLDKDLSARDKTGEVGIILRLNQVGPRYLIEDAGSINKGIEGSINKKGIEVWVAVRGNLGCLSVLPFVGESVAL
jgi:hypothetical protein